VGRRNHCRIPAHVIVRQFLHRSCEIAWLQTGYDLGISVFEKYRFVSQQEGAVRDQVVLAGLLVAFALICPVESVAQTCDNIPSQGGQTNDGFMKKSDSSCTVTSGGYVVVSQQYRVDEHATATGSCTVRAYDPYLPGCVVLEVQDRGVYAVTATIASGTPNGPYGRSMYPADGANQQIVVQDFDTRVDPVVTPPGLATWTPLAEGTTTMNFKGVIYVTNCNLTPGEFYASPMTVHVVKCAPKFKSNSQGVPIHLDAGSPPVYIYISGSLGSRLTDAIRQAIVDWNAANPNIELQETSSACSGGHCINTQLGSVPSGTCAASQIQNVDGVITGSTMTFPTAAQTWNANFLRMLVNHELGHHFGLDEYSHCTSTKFSHEGADVQCQLRIHADAYVD
jgi:hypothetical protein